MQQRHDTIDRRIARLASRSHGVATREQLLGVGVTPEQLRQRMNRGSLIRVHRGVYRAGHTAHSLPARYLAAVLACGEGAVLAGLAAAFMLELREGHPPPPTVFAPTARRVPGVHVRRCRVLGSNEKIVRDAIPMTSVPRTLIDLAGLLPPDDLVDVCHRAGVEYRTKPAQVRVLLARHPNVKGRSGLLAVLEGERPVTLSRLETRFLVLLHREKLPQPDEVNRFVDDHRIDCRWHAGRLTAELDSYRFHNSSRSWRKDRERERAAYARGDQHRRYTWWDVTERPAGMLRELRAVLVAP